MRKGRKKYKQALRALQKGKVDKAKMLLLELRSSTQDEHLKVDVNLTLMSCLNQVDDHSLMLEITDEGMKLSQKFSLKDAQATFCARHAVTLIQKQIPIMHRMKCIKLAPDWFEFAVERERDEYIRLEETLNTIHSKTGMLLEEAKKLASDDPQIQSQLLFETAQIHTQIMNAFIFINAKLNKRSLEKGRMLMSFKKSRELSKQLGEIKDLYINAAKASSKDTNHKDYAYCYYNLALTYSTALKHRKTDLYLNKAEEIAKLCDLKQILREIKEIRNVMKQKRSLSEDVDYGDLLSGL